MIRNNRNNNIKKVCSKKTKNNTKIENIKKDNPKLKSNIQTIGNTEFNDGLVLYFVLNPPSSSTVNDNIKIVDLGNNKESKLQKNINDSFGSSSDNVIDEKGESDYKKEVVQKKNLLKSIIMIFKNRAILIQKWNRNLIIQSKWWARKKSKS